MILMLTFSLNAQENEFLPIKNSLSEKKIKSLLKDYKPSHRNNPRLNKKMVYKRQDKCKSV